MAPKKPQIRTTINRPGHIQSQPTSDAYRENFDAIDWSSRHETADNARRGYSKRNRLTRNPYR